MLARSAPMPTRPGYAFEPKWDGFRALLSTERGCFMIGVMSFKVRVILP
jgi:ATP-dependent DNA ligase